MSLIINNITPDENEKRLPYDVQVSGGTISSGLVSIVPVEGVKSEITSGTLRPVGLRIQPPRDMTASFQNTMPNFAPSVGLSSAYVQETPPPIKSETVTIKVPGVFGRRYTKTVQFPQPVEAGTSGVILLALVGAFLYAFWRGS